MLTFGFPIVAIAIALYGAGNGIGSVARGTVPLALFGADRYPVLMGRLGFPLLVAMDLSPYFAGLAFQNGGPDLTPELVTHNGVGQRLLGGGVAIRRRGVSECRLRRRQSKSIKSRYKSFEVRLLAVAHRRTCLTAMTGPSSPHL